MISDNLLSRPSFNINMDSDGLLSYLFLKLGGFNGTINGYNNSDDLILSESESVEKLWSNSFIDIFIPHKNAYTIDQHIIKTRGCDNLSFSTNKINPHLIMEEHIAADKSYYRKYPFSTCLLILSILEREKKITKNLNFFKPTRKGFRFADVILRADGVLDNFVDYKENVKHWAKIMMDFSQDGINTTALFDYLLNLNDETARERGLMVSRTYCENGLKKDGGFNKLKSMKENIRILNLFMATFAKYLNINVNRNSISFSIYKGKRIITNANEFENIPNIDTYAFIGVNKLSYTTGYNKSDERIDTEILV